MLYRLDGQELLLKIYHHRAILEICVLWDTESEEIFNWISHLNNFDFFLSQNVWFLTKLTLLPIYESLTFFTTCDKMTEKSTEKKTNFEQGGKFNFRLKCLFSIILGFNNFICKQFTSNWLRILSFFAWVDATKPGWFWGQFGPWMLNLYRFAPLYFGCV